ncbi:dephospho-CoA kinase [Levilactobacillus huananensis]|uniref:dephospho-CoA kinase n=1 Tax=Levilactobacillus huananensis TaxID=2486019 RepID=UPI000F7B3FEF|nr:dephospho-CoA kinase [Levilactobacillus huananensis]
MTEVWGLTGGIATGKSTVSHWLRQAGLTVIDADLIARQVVAPGTSGLAQIVATFGEGYRQSDGALNRKKLGNLVFNDTMQLSRLEAITQPLIQAEIIRQLASAKARHDPVVVIDAPTFFEVGYLMALVDYVLVVATDTTTQQQRLQKRDGLSAEGALTRMAQQWPIARKVAAADVVIDNGGTIAQTRQQVVKWLDTNKIGRSNQIK